MSEPVKPVSNWRLAAYASPAMITYLAWMPLGYVIVKFYAKYTSLDLATIGLIILVGRLFDAFSDPAIAYLSDRFDTRWGRRKPWILLSAPVFATGFALLAMPPQNIHWSYFLLANIVLYSGWTFFEVTHIAWGLEFERDYERRTNIGVLLKFFAYVGSLAFFAFPFIFNTEPGSSEFTRPVMTALGIAVAASFPVLALLAVWTVPKEEKLGTKPFHIREAARDIFTNKNFLIYLSAYGLWVLSDGVLIGLFVVYVDAYHDLSASEGVILMATYFSRVLSVPLAMAMFRRFPRRTMWTLACLANALLFPSILLFPQGASAFIYLMTFAALVGIVDCVIGILAITMLGDVIDEDALRTGSDKAASYKASVNIVEKTLRAIGISGSIMLVGFAGLQLDGENTDLALLLLLLVLGLGPGILNFTSALTMRRLPISNKLGAAAP